MKTIGEILLISSDFLTSKGVAMARRSAEELLAFILKMRRLDLYMQYDRPLVEEELLKMREGVKALTNGLPLEYILGEVEFFGCRIQVDRRVLIPRPETELLVEHASKHLSSIEQQDLKVWDLCTGSGYIAIALKKKFPRLYVAASDLSSDALALAKENAKRNEVEIDFYQGDLLFPFAGQKADVVVCNPPYIGEEEYKTLDSSVRDYEPKEALIGGVKGYEFYERLSSELPSYLAPQAMVFLEIGHNQGADVKQIFSSSVWAKQELLKDWSGKDRFFILKFA